MRAIQFGSQVIEYTLSRSRHRNNISISVDKHGVQVVAPLEAPSNKIEEIMHQESP